MLELGIALAAPALVVEIPFALIIDCNLKLLLPLAFSSYLSASGENTEQARTAGKISNCCLDVMYGNFKFTKRELFKTQVNIHKLFLPILPT